MDEVWEITKTSAADLLSATPKAVRFFIDRGTACSICSLARFCTLEDVINAYNLDKKVFLEELAKLDAQKF